MNLPGRMLLVMNLMSKSPTHDLHRLRVRVGNNLNIYPQDGATILRLGAHLGNLELELELQSDWHLSRYTGVYTNSY
jgi:predicted LPLAT superfamily acyltransferase